VKAVNLIPQEQRVHTSGVANRSQGVAHIVLGLFAGIALLAVIYGSAAHQVSSKESEATRLEAEAQSTQQAASGLAQYKTFLALRESREQAIVGLINQRFDWANSISELGRVLPPGSTVTTLQGAVGSTGPSGATPAKSTGTVASATPSGTVPNVTISGCAASQSTVALILNRLRLMDGVSSVELHSSSKSGASGGGGAGGTAACPTGDPTYSATVSFEPLPAAPTSVPKPPTGKQGGSGANSAVNAADKKTEPTG